MIDHIQHLIGLGWHFAEFALYLIPVWVTALLLNKTAPLQCPDRQDSETCRELHPFHLNRQSAGWCVILGLFWPVALAIGVCWLFVKSVEHTPVPALTPMRKVNAQRMLEQSTAKVEADLQKLADEQDDAIIVPKVERDPHKYHKY